MSERVGLTWHLHIAETKVVLTSARVVFVGRSAAEMKGISMAWSREQGSEEEGSVCPVGN